MTKTPSTIHPPRLLWLLAVVALLAGCAGDDESATADPGDTDDAAAAVGDCENPVTTSDLDLRDTNDLADAERQAVEVFRARSAAVLVQPNPISCRGLTQADPRLDAASLGAFEVVSFTGADPDLRYDLVYFTQRQRRDAPHRDDIEADLDALNGPDTSLRVWAIGDTLYLALTTPTGDDEAEAIADHYNQIMAGEE